MKVKSKYLLRILLVNNRPQEEEERSGVKPATNQLVLNEVVIDRGPSPYLSNIDLYLDGKLITSVQVFHRVEVLVYKYNMTECVIRAMA